MEVTFVCANCNSVVVVEEIHSSGDWIVPPCVSCLEDAASNGYETGRDDGFDEGKEKGFQEGVDSVKENT